MHAPQAARSGGAAALQPHSCSKPTVSCRHVTHRVQAARQGPEPWDVLELQQQTTAWQQRQQQQQRKGRGQRQQQPRGGSPRGSSSSFEHERQQQLATSTGPFSRCRTFLEVNFVMQQLVSPAQDGMQQQQQQQQVSTSIQDSLLADGKQQQQQDEQQQREPPQQQAMQLLPLRVQDLVGLLSQLGTIARREQASYSSSSGGGGAVSSPFVEDQALQQTLAVVYVQLDQLLFQQQQGLLHPRSSLPPQQLLRCISTLAGLKYSQPVQLAGWLQAAAAPQKPPAAAAKPPAVPTAGAATAAAAGQAAAHVDIGSYRQALQQLRVFELSALVANLARSGVRPSNAWLLAFMQVAQPKLTHASLPQLAQVLSGLVKVGVKPTTAWLDSMETRAVQCLLGQAVRHQLPADKQQGQQQRQLSQTPSQEAAAAARNQPLQQGANKGRRGVGLEPGSRDAAVQLHHVAQFLSALAEARHVPKPQLAAVLWSATAASLAASDASALVELISALAELQLVPPAAWMQQYFTAAAAAAGRQQWRPWQLAGSVAAVGRLAVASRVAGPLQQQQQQQFAGCKAWTDAMLAAVQQQLPAFAPRDLAALVSGLAALQVHLPAQQVQLLLGELQGKLARVNTAGLADIAEAVAAFSRQWQQQQQQGLNQQQQQQQQGVNQQQQQQQGGFLQALVREVAVKLPVFPAEDLARVLLAVAAAGAQPSQLWLQAVAAQLSSKLTLLPPSTLVAVLAAFVLLGAPPDPSWVLTAAAALDGRLTALSAFELEQLLNLLVSLKVAPMLPKGWLSRAGSVAVSWQESEYGQQGCIIEAEGELGEAAGDVRRELHYPIARVLGAWFAAGLAAEGLGC